MNLSKKRREDFNLVLTRYGLERLLYRLSQSKYASDFVLKGAMLFAVWTKESHRPTRDLDLLSYRDHSGEHLATLFREICQVEVEPDGLTFDSSTLRVEEIRETQEYQGQRVQLFAYLSNARIKIQVDVGFGDVITPHAEEIEYPTLLDFPSPHIRAYPKESVVSEKLEAMVTLGMPNSRMKDFYDVWAICKIFPFEGSTLKRAIKETFERRKTPIPGNIPLALSEEFGADRDKMMQWTAFVKRNGLPEQESDLPSVISELRTFLIPPLVAAGTGEAFRQVWPQGGPWSNRVIDGEI
jgi:predicted nucleotidyltransferase component of viral defense system